MFNIDKSPCLGLQQTKRTSLSADAQTIFREVELGANGVVQSACGAELKSSQLHKIIKLNGFALRFSTTPMIVFMKRFEAYVTDNGIIRTPAD